MKIKDRFKNQRHLEKLKTSFKIFEVPKRSLLNQTDNRDSDRHTYQHREQETWSHRHIEIQDIQDIERYRDTDT